MDHISPSRPLEKGSVIAGQKVASKRWALASSRNLTALALMCQAAFLIAWHSTESGSYTLATLLILLAGISLFVRSNSLLARSALSCLGLGGVGMLVGLQLDGFQAHLHHIGLTAMVFSWMTGIMILFCMPACWMHCQDIKPLGFGSIVFGALGSVIAMLGGMILGMLYLVELLAQFELGVFISHFLAMLVGMTLGNMIFSLLLMPIGRR